MSIACEHTGTTGVVAESLVAWAFQKNPDQLSQALGIPLGRCLGTEFTTKHGRPDFIFELPNNDWLLIELETGIESAAKLQHCTEQVMRYLKLKNGFNGKCIQVALVYAKELTQDKYHAYLETFANEHGIILGRYSIQKMLVEYTNMLNQLNRTAGLSLGRAVALGVTSITWLKKFIGEYFGSYNSEIQDSISWVELKNKFSSKTNFYVLKRLAEDFELIQINKAKKKTFVALTESGRRFRDEQYVESLLDFNVNEETLHIPDSNVSATQLTTGQQRILLEVLVNGNFTKLKVNIFHFLRYIQLTEGSRLPKQNSRLTPLEKQYLNDIFRASYNTRTLKDLVQQTCTICDELGLVERIHEPNLVYDKVIFTSLGSRVYYYFEQLLAVERERYQIPLQVG